MCVPGTELRSSGGAASSPNCRTTAPAHPHTPPHASSSLLCGKSLPSSGLNFPIPGMRKLERRGLSETPTQLNHPGSCQTDCWPCPRTLKSFLAGGGAKTLSQLLSEMPLLALGPSQAHVVTMGIPASLLRTLSGHLGPLRTRA